MVCIDENLELLYWLEFIDTFVWDPRNFQELNLDIENLCWEAFADPCQVEFPEKNFWVFLEDCELE